MGWETAVQSGSDLLATGANLTAQRRANDRNEAMQREFAQNGIRWRVEDARRAGINPLVALGGGGASFSPSFVAGNPGEDIRHLGQDISRAFQPSMTEAERQAEILRLELLRKQVEETDARALLYTTQRAKFLQSGLSSSPFPTGKDGQVTIKPSQTISRDLKDSSKTAGAGPAWDRKEIMPGVFLDVPQSDDSWGESMEGLLPSALTIYRNAIDRPFEYVKGRVQQLKRRSWRAGESRLD